ncbi:MAG TPA: SRPBCC domain-containing protein, partial [Usitatibacter sp.]|nr:SRPBCC domain-containing protein [Usitatibacter sp.]
PTTVDPEVAKLQEPHRGKPFEFVVDSIEPMHRISFRWHPFAVEPGVDYSQEPSTLIVFELQAVAGGTQLTVTESGFDRIPVERRAKAFAANDAGWEHQVQLVRKYVERQAA